VLRPSDDSKRFRAAILGARRMSDSAAVTRFTDPAWWDSYWQGLELPAEIHKHDGPVVEAITDVFDRFLPTGGSALEIGGSSGRYAVYIYRTRGSTPVVLESSPVGHAAAERNFELLQVPGRAILGDMFDESLDIEPLDIVYSLGLIEHFDDTEAVARAHLRHLKPGGTLIIGAPNLGGVNGPLFRRLSPSIFESHDAASADPRNWEGFERDLRLDVVHKAYVGGFDPELFWRLESRSKLDWLFAVTLKHLGRLLRRSRLRPLRRFNHRLWSAYVVAVYRKPTDSA
jgi:SAM-dependent methyltransferase